MPDTPALPSSAHDLSPHRMKGLLLRSVGYTVLWGGGLIAFVVFLLLLFRTKGLEFSGFLGILVYLPFALTGQWIMSKARANLAIGAIEVLKHDSRPPVLYLRSFTEDVATAHIAGTSGQSEEEMVASALRHIGPFVAIGNPSEGIPRPGAARLYVSNEEWQAAVHELMVRSRLVIIRVGTTQGLWWEIAQSITNVKPSALLLLVPFANEGYATFKENADKVFPKPFPDVAEPFGKPAGSIRATISFQPDWTPELRFAETQLLKIDDERAVEQLIESSVSVAWQARRITSDERLAYKLRQDEESERNHTLSVLDSTVDATLGKVFD